MKTLSQSRTVRFNMLMAVVAAVHGSLALFQPMLTPEQFAYVTMFLGALNGIGNIYLRSITSEPIK